MIFPGTKCKIIDNSGGLVANIFHCKKKNRGGIGSIVVCSLRKVRKNHPKMKKGKVERGIVVRTAKKIQRKDGTCIKFDSNAICLINRRNTPRGKRIFGPISYDVRRLKLFSMASFVL